MRALFASIPKAALFDALTDAVSLRHPESCDAAMLDDEWMRSEITLLVERAGWKVPK